TEVFATVLKNLGTKKALVVHGSDGMDEITLCEETRVTELLNDRIKTYNLNPREFFERTYHREEFRGGKPETNAQIIRDILAGKLGAPRDIVLINAAAALLVGGKVGNINEGIELAKEIIDSGQAKKKLKDLIEISNS
ncbi:MAG: anthranilate phosphoribosyltransferase, partial [Desulfobacterota bacterium]|nr:anthranilate phosphoribosyltransferase [Thermodesulfobacteriota bacterium]